MNIHRFDYEKTRVHFDMLAESHPDMVGMYVFPSRWNPLFRSFFEENVVSEILAGHNIGINRNMTVLDLGCGGGRWCAYFAERAGHVIGVDISPSSLKLAEENARKRDLDNVEFVCSNIPEFRPARKLDLVFIGGVANYLADESLAVTLDALSDRVGSGAVFIIRDSLTNKGHEVDKGYFTRYRTADDFESLLGQRGFRLIDRRAAFPARVARLDFSGVEGLLATLGESYINNYFSAIYEDISAFPNSEPTWNEGDYMYWHDFMVFRRA
jgi:SAM-dependent methyltransferase